MPLAPFVIQSFGGLDLTSDPEEVGPTGAVNMLNVTFKPRGAIGTRPGLTVLTAAFNQTSPSTNNFQHMHEAHDGTLLAGAGTKVYAINSSTGALVTADTYTPSGAFANYGGPVEHTTGATFVGQAGTDVPVVWTGSIFGTASYAGTQPTGDGLAFTSLSGRMVNWGIPGNPFRVIFSDPGDPYVFPANNFVDLVSEDFVGLRGRFGCSWSGDLHLLTQRFLHVFPAQGEGIDSGGNPIFNLLRFATPFADSYVSHMVAGTDGLYFMTSNGLYRYRGGTFTLVSDAVSPIVQGATPFGGPTHLYLLGESNVHRARAVGDQLFFPCSTTDPTGPPDYMLVWDLRTQGWLLWSMTHHALGFLTNQRRPRLLVSQRTGTSPNPITFLDPDATTDNGTSILWNYTSGYYPLSDAGRVAVTLESSFTGYAESGNVLFTVGSDVNESTYAASDTVHPPTARPEAETWLRQDQEGKLFLHAIQGGGPMTISRVTHYVSYVKPAGIG